GGRPIGSGVALASRLCNSFLTARAPPQRGAIGTVPLDRGPPLNHLVAPHAFEQCQCSHAREHSGRASGISLLVSPLVCSTRPAPARRSHSRAQVGQFGLSSRYPRRPREVPSARRTPENAVKENGGGHRSRGLSAVQTSAPDSKTLARLSSSLLRPATSRPVHSSSCIGSTVIVTFVRSPDGSMSTNVRCS